MKLLLKKYKWPFIVAAIFLALCYWVTHEKYIEYEEEVMLGEPPKLEVIKRREVLELRVNQLKPRWTYVRSELYLFGQKKPVWSDDLRPLYLEKLPNDEGYLLVAGIESGWECYERGRPNSYYVTVKFTPTEMVEISTPGHLEGKPSNLLFRFGVIPKGMERISLAEKKRLNNLYYKLSKHQEFILLSSEKRCQ